MKLWVWISYILKVNLVVVKFGHPFIVLTFIKFVQAYSFYLLNFQARPVHHHKAKGSKEPEQPAETTDSNPQPLTSTGTRIFRGRIKLTDLSCDALEHVARYLDTRSAVALLRTCKTIYGKLIEVLNFEFEFVGACMCKNAGLNNDQYCIYSNTFVIEYV